MIAVDASAVLAILLDEPDSTKFADCLQLAGGVISPVNYWEVLARAFSDGRDAGAERAEALVSALGISIASVAAEDARRAFVAFTRFGKSAGGPLNLGDCFAYALAEQEGDGLLFKGDDFPKTNVKSALS